MIPVRDATLADVKPNQSSAAFDGVIERLIVDAGFLGQHQRQHHRQCGSVHHAVPLQPAIGLRKTMPPRPDLTLPVADLQRDPPQIRKVGLVAGGKRIFSK